MIRKLVARQCVAVGAAMFIVSCATPAPPEYILYSSVNIEGTGYSMGVATPEATFPSSPECRKEQQRRSQEGVKNGGRKYSCISDVEWSRGPPRY